MRRTLGACFSMLLVTRPFPLTRSLGSGCHLPKVTYESMYKLWVL